MLEMWQWSFTMNNKQTLDEYLTQLNKKIKKREEITVWGTAYMKGVQINLMVFADTSVSGKNIHGPLKQAQLKHTISSSDRLSWYKYKQIMLTVDEIYKNIIHQALLAKYQTQPQDLQRSSGLQVSRWVQFAWIQLPKSRPLHQALKMTDLYLRSRWTGINNLPIFIHHSAFH